MDAPEKAGFIEGLSRKEMVGRVIFLSCLLPILAISTICVVNALAWINKPFPGFLLNERMVVAPVGQYQWTGTYAGLRYPDKILTADGKPISSIKELESVLDAVPYGGVINYAVEREGRIFEIWIAKMQFTLADLFMTFGALMIAGIAFLLIGLIVFIMKPNTKVSWIFLIACLFLSMWSITIFDMQSTHYGFIRFYLLASVFFPAAFIHFSFYFPEPRRFVVKHPRIQYLPYIVALMITVPMEVIYPERGFAIFYSLTLLYMILAALILLEPVTFAYFRPSSVLARQRAKVVLLGAAIAFPLPAVAYFSQLFFGSFLGLRIQTNFLALILLFFPASIAYAVARHNLFDVDVYIKRAVGYVIMTALIVGAYALVSVSFNILVGQYQIAQSKAFPILFTLGVILVFNPLRNRVQVFVDKVFFRKEYDYGEIIDKIGAAITSLLDLGQVLKRLTQAFVEDMFVNTTCVLLLSPAADEYRIHLAEGEHKAEIEGKVFKRDEPLMRIIEEQKKVITKYDVLEDPKYRDVSGDCARNFESLNATLMVPLIFKDRIIGMLSMGEKKSGKFFNREDIDLMHALANQGAVAIENARLFQENLEKQRMEEELAIARDLQMSMLPAVCPQIKGFEIAAVSMQAREVGGDFFDFIEMGEDRVGLVVGDVTGKSVSGALVMSASRSVFRMLSEEELGVGEIMIRANRRTKKDIKSGMFVALLYAVLDSRDKTLSMCSAGQTQPVHFSAENGKAVLVETKGDAFPLGILDDADYEETRLLLKPGDTLVFYTDGIVEAMDAKSEMFGFGRLLELVEGTGRVSAEQLLKEILERVQAFSGETPQHDDLTVIVISVSGLNPNSLMPASA